MDTCPACGKELGLKGGKPYCSSCYRTYDKENPMDTATTRLLHPASQFFYDHAGYSYNRATETPEEGRMRCANKLAAAEMAYHQSDAYVLWEGDLDGTADGQFPAWQAVLVRPMPNNSISEVLAALGGIDTDDEDYRRVIEAELASEASDRL